MNHNQPMITWCLQCRGLDTLLMFAAVNVSFIKFYPSLLMSSLTYQFLTSIVPTSVVPPTSITVSYPTFIIHTCYHSICIILPEECQAMKPSIDEAIATLQRLVVGIYLLCVSYLMDAHPLSQEDDMKAVNEKFQEAMVYYRKYAFHIPNKPVM